MAVSTREKKFYDFIEMCNEIDGILGFDQRDAGKHYHPDSGDFYEWCDSKGYGEKDPEGKYRGSSQIWFAEHQEECRDGKWFRTPYMDFWHWQLDNCVGHDFSNDSYSTVCVHPDCASDAEEWQKEIQQVWWETYKDIADENGYIDIWVSW